MSSSRKEEGLVWRSFQPPGHEAGAHETSRKRARPNDEGVVSSETRKVLDDARLLCRNQAAAIYRKVSNQVYGKTFEAIARFLGRSRSDASQWGKLLGLLESKSGPKPGAAASAKKPASDVSSVVGGRDRQEHGGFDCLIPCAIIHPNMSPGDRSLLIHLLLNSLRRRCGPDMTVVTIRARLHGTLPKIFAALHHALAQGLRTRNNKAGGRSSSGGWQAPRRLLGGPTSFQDVLSLHADLPASLRRQRVLLVFEDVEALDTRLLESLLCLLGESALELPLQLVFLVSSSCPFAANLGTSATSVLEACTFTLPPAITCFERVLERLFLNCELPVTVSGPVLRFLRTSFSDSHGSITVFFRHLDFLLHRHFESPLAILCMLPYIQKTSKPAEGGTTVPGTTASSSSSASSRLDRLLLSPGEVEDADYYYCDNGEGGEQQQEEDGPLTVNPDFPWQKRYKEHMYLHVDALLELGSLQSIERAEDLPTNYRLVQKAVKDQVARRFEVWAAVHLVYKAVRVLKQQGEWCRGPLDALQALLDVEQRPADWEGVGRRLKDGIADTSLRELEQLVLEWDWLLTEIMAGPSEPDDEEEEAQKKKKKKKGRKGASSERQAPVPRYVAKSSLVLRSWGRRVDALVSLLRALAKETAGGQQWDQQHRTGDERAGSSSKAKAQAKQGFQSRRMALAAQGMMQEAAAGGGAAKDGEASGGGEEEAALLEQQQREFRIKERGVRNAVIEVLTDVTEHCIDVARAPTAAQEAMWCGDTQALELAFFAQVRAAAVRKLADPQSHLRCSCCAPGDVNANMPDRCIVYNLYEEDTRRTVGLSSLFEQFADVVTAESGRDAANKEQESRLRLRLQHGINELEQLGFLKPWGTKGEWAKMVYSYTCLTSADPGMEGSS